jgi:hypothetical protein
MFSVGADFFASALFDKHGYDGFFDPTYLAD